VSGGAFRETSHVRRAGGEAPAPRCSCSGIINQCSATIEQSDHGATRHTLRGIDDFIEGYLSYDGGRCIWPPRMRSQGRAWPMCTRDCSGCCSKPLRGPVRGKISRPGRACRAAGHAARAAERGSTAFLVDDDLATTLRLCEQISDEFPRDLVIVKTHQYLNSTAATRRKCCAWH